jgi:HK97 family phage major capsid protein
MNLNEMQDKRGQLVTEARSALDEIKANTDEARATELESAMTRSWASSTSSSQHCARAARRQAGEGSRRGPQGQASRPERRRPRRRRGREGRVSRCVRCARSRRLQPAGAFGRAARSLKAGVAEFRAQSTTAAAGGYTVPTDLAASVDKTMKMWGPMYDEAICTVLNTASGNAIDFPTTDDTAVAVVQHTEGSAMTDDASADAVSAKMTLNAFDYDTKWIQVSMELLQDSNINVESFIGELLGERLARRVNVELTTGDGTGDPNGIVVASAAGKTAASTTPSRRTK